MQRNTSRSGLPEPRVMAAVGQDGLHPLCAGVLDSLRPQIARWRRTRGGTAYFTPSVRFGQRIFYIKKEEKNNENL